MFNYSFLAVLINLALMVLNNGDRFIINFYKGKAQLGIYSQVYNLASAGFLAIIQVFNSITAPALNRQLTTNRDRSFINDLIQTYYLIFTPITIFLINNSRILVESILGSRFAGFSDVFSWVVGSTYLYGIANFLEIRLKFLNKSSLLLVILLLSACINVGLNLAGLRFLNLVYAAITTFVTYFLLLLLLARLNSDVRLFTILRQFILPTAFAAIFYYMSGQLIQNFGLRYSLLSLLLDGILASLIFYLFFKKFYPILKRSIPLITNTQ